jgi:hypothetical protein
MTKRKDMPSEVFDVESFTPAETPDAKHADTEPPPPPPPGPTVEQLQAELEAERAAHKETAKALKECIAELHSAARMLKGFGLTYNHPALRF